VWQHRLPGSGKPNIRSYQQVGLAHIDTEIAPGEQAEQRGLLTEAYHHYDSAMRGFVHPDLGLGVSLRLRCASASDAQCEQFNKEADALAFSF
jgi:hypothetical protein